MCCIVFVELISPLYELCRSALSFSVPIDGLIICLIILFRWPIWPLQLCSQSPLNCFGRIQSVPSQFSRSLSSGGSSTLGAFGLHFIWRNTPGTVMFSKRHKLHLHQPLFGLKWLIGFHCFYSRNYWTYNVKVTFLSTLNHLCLFSYWLWKETNKGIALMTQIWWLLHSNCVWQHMGGVLTSVIFLRNKTFLPRALG